MKYAIQGLAGSYHHLAINKYLVQYTDTDVLIECRSFHSLVDVVKGASPEQPITGIMAIENSSVGSLLYNYNLIRNSHLRIIGEVYIHIQHHLLVNQGVQFEDIKEVYSHPIAIQQCMKFLLDKNWKRVENEDTALSVKKIRDEKLRSSACIASEMAGKMYGLHTLEKNINDFKKNYTRFLIVTNERGIKEIEGANKASIQFCVKNNSGSLSSVLNVIKKYNINMSKLQSFAKPDTHFTYYFHADLDFDDKNDLNATINELKVLTEGLTIFGVYKKGIRHANF